MSEAVAIDVLLSIGGRISFSAKIIVEDVHEALFANIIHETLLEYAQSTLTPDRSEDEDATDDPFEVEARCLVHCITSIKCRGVETTKLLSFVQRSGTKMNILNSKTMPFVKNGLVVHVVPKDPPSQPPKAKANAFSIMLGQGTPSTLRFIVHPPIEDLPQLHVSSRGTETEELGGWQEALGEFKRTLESIDYRYSCGDLIFSDNHPRAKIITQRLNITCESKIETAYYNPGERDLKTVDVCIHCGEEGEPDFLYGQDELEEMNKTGGKECYPICKLCLAAGKKIETYAKKKTNQVRKRKEDEANKNAEARRRRKKNS